MQRASDASQSTKSLIANGILTAVLAMLFVPYLFAAGMSVMMFDAPGSTSNPWIWLAFVGVWAYPGACTLLMFAGWVLFALQRHVASFRVAIVGIIATTAPPVLLLGASSLMSMMVSF